MHNSIDDCSFQNSEEMRAAVHEVSLFSQTYIYRHIKLGPGFIFYVYNLITILKIIYNHRLYTTEVNRMCIVALELELFMHWLWNLSCLLQIEINLLILLDHLKKDILLEFTILSYILKSISNISLIS